MGNGNGNRSGPTGRGGRTDQGRREGKDGPEEPNKAYVGSPYVWTEGYLRWTRRAEAWEEDGTINDAIPSQLARMAHLHRGRVINGPDVYKKYTTVFFPSSRECVEALPGRFHSDSMLEAGRGGGGV
jgi:hypothetical protein